MVDLLLYTTISCSDSREIIQRVKSHEDLNQFIKNELIITIKESAPECDWYWDAND